MSLEQLSQLTADLWVGPQVQAADFSAIAAKGFRTVINARPDREASDQPGSDELAVAAAKAGITYEYLPVIPNQISPQDVEKFAQHLKALPKPILAFCRTGNRCSQLWSLVKARGLH
ncbi:MAG TPA: TIGR01244 family sulfur transferase [Spongiibacteraceae bacterium]|nr:TIGR01244 family sulfur transferase [Spongiibacteraceae bacterium]